MRLTSGLEFGIGADMIFEPGTQWFPCPPNHFWYWTPDLKLSPPPYMPNQTILRDAKHAEVPATVEGLYPYLIVMVMLPDGTVHWPGEWFADFLARLSPADRQEVDEWLRTEKAQQFLSAELDRCRTQAEFNEKTNTQPFVTFTSAPSDPQ